MTRVNSALLTCGFIVKLGLFPFHFWFIRVGRAINFYAVWYLSIPQKTLPFWGLLRTTSNIEVLLISVIGGTLIRLENVLRTSRLNLILIYSSIINRRWFLLIMLNYEVFCFVFLIYGLSLALLVQILSSKAQLFLTENRISYSDWTTRSIILLLLLNLAGMPPLLNLWTKIVILQSLLQRRGLILTIIFIISSLIFLYAYLRLGFTFFILTRRKPFLLRTLSSYRSFAVLIVLSRIFFIF